MKTNKDITYIIPYTKRDMASKSDLYHTPINHDYYYNSNKINGDYNFSNMTVQDTQEYLEQLQDNERPLYIPTLIFNIIVIVVGVFGNSLVLMVYKSKRHTTPTMIFIMAIAVFDLISNIVCLPADTAELLITWNYKSDIPCRLAKYATYSTTMTSACILLALAIVRYMKICRPFGKQATLSHAKILSFIIALICWIFSVPYAIMYGIHTKPTPISGVVGWECSFNDDFHDTIWISVNSIFILVLFITVCVPLLVLYTLIGVQAYKHSAIHGQSPVNTKAQSSATRSRTISNTRETSENLKESALSKSTLTINKNQSRCKMTTENQITESLDYQDCSTHSDHDCQDCSTHSEHDCQDCSTHSEHDKETIQDKAEDMPLDFESKNEFVASTLHWVDTKHSLDHEDTDAENRQDNETFINKETPPKKISKEDCSLQKQEKYREAVSGSAGDERRNIEFDGIPDKAEDYRGRVRNNTDDEIRAIETKKDEYSKSTTSLTTKGKKYSKSENNSLDKKSTTSKNNPNRKSIMSRTTIMLIVITSVFCLSYVPYFYADFIRLNQRDTIEALGVTSFSIQRLCLRIPFINSAANAIIYSLCDNKFRKDAFNLFKFN